LLLGLGCPKQAFAKIATPLIDRSININGIYFQRVNLYGFRDRSIISWGLNPEFSLIYASVRRLKKLFGVVIVFKGKFIDDNKTEAINSLFIRKYVVH